MIGRKSSTVWVRLLALILVVSSAAAALAPRMVSAHPSDQTGNLLTNPGFEPFVTPDGKFDYPIFETPEGGGHVAEGWKPWWYNDEGPTYSVPEYDIAPIYRDPYRVRTGNAAQQIFRPSVMWLAGVYQQVQVPANASLRFTIYGHSWATFCKPTENGGHDCNARDSNHGGANPATMRIGIDPYGGTDWRSSNIVWSNDYNIHDNYEQLIVDAQAVGETVTVYTYTTFQYPAVINNVYWDDAALVLTAPPPTPTPIPTATPVATATPEPTGLVVEAKTTVNVRTGPGTSYPVLGQIRPGVRYNVLGQSGDWYVIDFNRQTGYVYGPLVTVTAGTVPEIPPGQGVEAKVTLNVRSGPGTQYSIIGKIYPGQVYRITGEQSGWYRIDYNGKPGWVNSAFVVVR